MRRLSRHNHSQVEAPARWPLLTLLAVAIAFPGCAGGGASLGTRPPPSLTITVSVSPPTSRRPARRDAAAERCGHRNRDH